MKTGKELCNELSNYPHLLSTFFEKIQNEAWNEAIEAAAENAEIRYLGGNSDINDFEVDKNSILKLKK